MATNPTIEANQPVATLLQRIGLPRLRWPRLVAENSEMPASAQNDPRARRRLLDEISNFLIESDLEVTPSNLLAAHEACSGINPRLARRIEWRREQGEPITQTWLEEVTAVDPFAGKKSIEDLAKDMERGIDELSRTSTSMRRATSDYGDELERRVDDLQGPCDTAELISTLSNFAEAMIARSRQTEEELKASERETAKLRKNLDRARQDAQVDYLTGLPNRRAFEEVLETSYLEAQDTGEPLSVAFCDIDQFKAINDTHGHEAGDRIIREIAETLSSLCTKDCYIARHGGEEFVLLFRGVEPQEALAQLDEAREALASRRMVNRRTEKPFGMVTFSGGIADVLQCADPREALAAADQALYCAKRSGRNRIHLAGGQSRAA
ncbi:diguanylate cyclase [Citromicrobium sp. RCC1897]|nr:diguanylate cyclase [Citromicrobium sp. RCC1897]|tara:strand:- start:16032 stop:17174 length:1143 start_codon:yes stop_codon:yes gene_type:complete